MRRPPVFADAAGASDLCVAIPSHQRNVSYLAEAVASAAQGLQRLGDAGALRAHLVVLDVSGGAREDVRFLRDAEVRVVDTAISPASEAADGGAAHGTVKKEALDYARALETCARDTPAKVVAVLEDDALSARNLGDGIMRAAQQASDIARKPNGWVLKLFRTGHFDGWSRTTQHATELVVSSAVSAVFFLLVFAVPQQAAARAESGSKLGAGEELCSALARLVAVGAATAAALYALGRANTLGQFGAAPLAGVRATAGEGGTVGVAYPREVAIDFAQHLREHPREADLELIRYVRHSPMSLVNAVVWPNLVEHLGLRTSIHHKARARRNADVTWFPHFKRSELFYETEPCVGELVLRAYGPTAALVAGLVAAHVCALPLRTCAGRTRARPQRGLAARPRSHLEDVEVVS